MQYLKLIYILIIILQLAFTIRSMKWFGFRNNKEDKDDKDGKNVNNKNNYFN